VRLEAGFAVRSLAFDASGMYLGVTGADARVFAGKTLAHVKTFSDHAAPVSGICFGPDATWIGDGVDGSNDSILDGFGAMKEGTFFQKQFTTPTRGVRFNPRQAWWHS
jgi:WD40 repeat protein